MPDGAPLRIILACFAAGPLFIISTALVLLYAEWPRPETFGSVLIFGLTFALVPVIAAGALLAAVPVLIGAALMNTLADRYRSARVPIVWLFVGALFGTIIALAFRSFETVPSIGFGLIATSALCALICRFRLRWD